MRRFIGVALRDEPAILNNWISRKQRWSISGRIRIVVVLTRGSSSYRNGWSTAARAPPAPMMHLGLQAPASRRSKLGPR